MMRKFLLVAVLITFFMPFHSLAKINWVYDMQTAKAIALGQNKLIVIDFWATWCGPCKKMESEFWNSDKVSVLNEKFVFLKIDIDLNSRLATQFGVKGIPYIVIADILGNKIWDVTGSQGAGLLYEVLKDLPNEAAAINKAELPLFKDESNDCDLINVGRAYADIGKDLKNKMLKKNFLQLSTWYFKKVKRGVYKEEAELRRLLNRAYSGRTKKLSKKVKAIPETEKNKELRQFILSYIQKIEK